MATMAKQITLDELQLSQGGKLSRGFNALHKLTDTQLLVVGDTLAAGDYKPRANRYSAFAQLVGHSAPTTHAEARYVALRYFEAKGIPIEMFSTGSVWHSTPARVARRFAANSSLARYDANHANVFSGYKLVCVTHNQTQQRASCEKACLQALVSNETGKVLYSVATKKQFVLDGAKPKARKATSKPKAKRTVAPIAPPTDDEKGDNKAKVEKGDDNAVA